MAQLFLAPLLQLIDTNGAPYSGALAYFYATSTTTAITAYQDSALTTPHANPVVADASGQSAPIYLADGSYKVVLKDSGGVIIRTVDPVLSAGGAASTPTGFLYGLTLSNNGTDATNDIDIATGSARNDADTATISLSLGITKRLDAGWSVGTGNGGLDTGSIANTTYHVFLIKRSDTGVVDALFTASAGAPTMPANYDQKRRIGSIIRSGGTILAFRQNGNNFRLATAVQSYFGTNPGTAAVTITATVPTGLANGIIYAGVVLQVTNGTSNQIFALATALDETDRAASATNPDLQLVSGVSAPGEIRAVPLLIKASSGQFRLRLSASGVADAAKVSTFGWVDSRGY